MIQIVKSLLGSCEVEFQNELQLILSDDNKFILSKDEQDVFKYLEHEFSHNKQFPTAEVFLIKFPQYRLQLDEVDAFSLVDLRYYRKQFITKHQNIYKAKMLQKMAAEATVDGITPDMLETIRKQTSFEESIVEENLSFRERYTNSMKENSGLLTFVEPIDDQIGSITKGAVCTIAGFTGSGKCVSENERIFTNRGLLTIKEIYNIGINKGLKVQSEYGFKDLVAVHDEGVKDSYIISIGNIPVETSPVHRFRVLTDNCELIWKEAKELKIGDKIVQSLKESHHTDGIIDDPDFWHLYGQMCGDGGHASDQFYLCGALNNLKKMDSERLFKKFFTSYSLTETKPRKEGYQPLFVLRAYTNKSLRSELNDFIGKTSKTKVFPDRLYYLNRECWDAFVLGLYETDGCSNRNCLGFGLTNKQFLIKLSRLLSCMGITTNLYNKCNDAYMLSVTTAKSMNRFINIINSATCKAHKPVIIDEIKDVSRPFNTRRAFEEIKSDNKFTRKDYAKFGRFGTKTSGCNLNKITTICEEYPIFKNNEYLKEIVDAELTWNTVTNIEQSRCYMYDLTVDGSPTYLLNGYVTHNTTWAINMAVKNALMGKNIAYISLEVTKEQLEYSILSLFSNEQRFSRLGYSPLEHQKIRQNKLQPDEINFLCDVLEPEYRKAIEPNLHILDESVFKTFSESEILDVLYKLDDEKPLDAVFFDHAGLFAFKSPLYNSGNVGVAINKYVSFIRQLSISFRVKDGKSRSIASVLLAQTNRSGWKEAARSFKQLAMVNRPGNKNKNNNNDVTQIEGYKLSALSDANELERCSSVVLAVYTDQNLKASGQAYVQMLKTRYGSEVPPTAISIDLPVYKFGDSDACVDEAELSADLVDSLSSCSIVNNESAGTNIMLDDDDIFGL